MPPWQRDTTSIVFTENQLSPALIGLSPLATAHPMPLQRQRVRSSTALSCCFHLAMASSTGFGSAAGDRRGTVHPTGFFAFTAPPPPRLKLRHRTATGRAMIQKVRRGGRASAPQCAPVGGGTGPPTPPTAAAERQVAFLRSLTVLLLCRSRRSESLLGGRVRPLPATFPMDCRTLARATGFPRRYCRCLG